MLVLSASEVKQIMKHVYHNCIMWMHASTNKLRAPIITGRCCLSPETRFLSQETYCLHVSCHKKHVPRETTPVSCDRKPTATSCHKTLFSSRGPRSSSLELRPFLVTRNAPLGPGSRGCKKRAFKSLAQGQLEEVARNKRFGGDKTYSWDVTRVSCDKTHVYCDGQLVSCHFL